MHKAFTSQKPVLIFENLNTETGKNIQQGYMNIFSGAMMGIRNQRAHANVTLTKREAVQRLMLASLLMSKVDQAVFNSRFGRLKKFLNKISSMASSNARELI